MVMRTRFRRDPKQESLYRLYTMLQQLVETDDEVEQKNRVKKGIKRVTGSRRYHDIKGVRKVHPPKNKACEDRIKSVGTIHPTAKPNPSPTLIFEQVGVLTDNDQ